MKKCSSCNKVVQEGYIEFSCPSCGKNEIIRCENCRENSKKYICSECGFEGP